MVDNRRGHLPAAPLSGCAIYRLRHLLMAYCFSVYMSNKL